MMGMAGKLESAFTLPKMNHARRTKAQNKIYNTWHT
jgi:hypothetical protein